MDLKVNCLKGHMVAHRGIYGNRVVENTLDAFSLALSQEVPIELDLRILHDGNIVVFHDDNLKRLLGIDRDIFSYDYSELKKLRFPDTDAYIPLFQEVLDLVQGKVFLVIEIKRVKEVHYSNYLSSIVSILKKYSHNFVIQAFDIRIVHWFLKNTDYIVGLLIANRKNSFYDWIMRRQVIISILKPDFISVDYSIANTKVVQWFRKKGPVLLWTIKTREILDDVERFGDSYVVENLF